MADDNTKVGDLKDLKKLTEAPAPEPVAAPENEPKETAETPTEPVMPDVVEPKIDDLGRSYATGKRKDAVARVWLKPGAGRITVNGREL